jgi:sugar phosphate isomerase/epimerase
LTSGFTPLGEGLLRWPQVLAMLAAHGYHGWLAVENFTGNERGVARIVDDFAWLGAQIAAADAPEGVGATKAGPR